MRGNHDVYSPFASSNKALSHDDLPGRMQMRFWLINKEKRSFVQYLALNQQCQDAEVGNSHSGDR